MLTLKLVDESIVQRQTYFWLQVQKSHLREEGFIQSCHLQYFTDMRCILRYEFYSFNNKVVCVVEHVNNVSRSYSRNKRLYPNSNTETFLFQLFVKPKSLLYLWDVWLDGMVEHVRHRHLKRMQIRVEVFPCTIKIARLRTCKNADSVFCRHTVKFFCDMICIFTRLKRVTHTT